MRTDQAPRILIADDQADVLEALRLLLKPEGFVTDTAASPAHLLRALELKDYDVVLMDLNYTRDTTSGEEGLDLLQRIHTADESLTVVVMHRQALAPEPRAVVPAEGGIAIAVRVRLQILQVQSSRVTPARRSSV